MNWRASTDKWLRVSVRRRLLDQHLKELRSHMHGRVLEVGAGRAGRRGEFDPPLKQAKSWLYLNLDSQVRPHVRGDVAAMPFRTGRFETLLCLEVLEYVSNPQCALREMRRMLNTKGKLILSLPFMHRADRENDYWRFTEPGIRYLLANNGFDVVWFKGQGAALAVVVNILKYNIHIREGRSREWLGWFIRPVLDYMWNRDGNNAQKFPLLTTFSTGCLVMARAKKG